MFVSHSNCQLWCAQRLLCPELTVWIADAHTSGSLNGIWLDHIGPGIGPGQDHCQIWDDRVRNVLERHDRNSLRWPNANSDALPPRTWHSHFKIQQTREGQIMPAQAYALFAWHQAGLSHKLREFTSNMLHEAVRALDTSFYNMLTNSKSYDGIMCAIVVY